MKKIICVTLNPAMDKTIFINSYQEGHVNSIDEVYYEIGGKGINVAKVLQHFQIKSIVTGFIGNTFTDAFRIKLMKLGIETKFFKLLQDTRTNTKVIDKSSGLCTTLRESGPFVPEELLERFIASFSLMCHNEDIVLLSGTMPPGVPRDIYYTLTKIAKEKGSLVIIDAAGDVLEHALDAKPDILKTSYRDLLPENRWHTLSMDDFPDIIEKVKQTHIPTILVSMGHLGALFIHENTTYYAKAVELGIELKYPVGAGDAMVGALIMSYIEEFDALNTLKYAIACATACVLKKDTCHCEPTQINELLSQVVVTKLVTD